MPNCYKEITFNALMHVQDVSVNFNWKHRCTERGSRLGDYLVGEYGSPEFCSFS